MSEQLQQRACLVTDRPVGWTRRLLLDEKGKPFRLHLAIDGRDALELGDMHLVRVTKADPGGGGVFARALNGSDIYVRAKRPITEGELIAANISSEQRTGKNAVAALASPPAELVRDHNAPVLLTKAAEDPFLAGVEATSPDSDTNASQLIDAAIDEAHGGAALLAGGGVVSVTPTPALVAIDVDTRNRRLKGDRRSLFLAANLEAAETSARLLSLAGLGGLVVADFLRMGVESDRQKLTAAWASALRQRYGRKCQVGRFSGFGLLEASISHAFTPIPDLFSGLGVVHLAALRLFQAIEREGRANRGGRLEVGVAPNLKAWLEKTDLSWESELVSRLGPRFSIRLDDRLADAKFNVIAK